MFGLWIVLAVIPVVMERNFPPPKLAETTLLEGLPIQVKKYPPHLTIQTAKGELKELNFPLVMSSPFDKKSGQLTFATDVENRFRHMSAAKVRVYVDNIQSIHPRVYPRIWEIQSESFSLSYEHLLLNYNKLEPGVLRGFEWIMGVVSVALGVLIDYLRQRNHRRLAMEKRLATIK